MAIGDYMREYRTGPSWLYEHHIAYFLFKFFIYLLVYIRQASSLFSMSTSIYVLATTTTFLSITKNQNGGWKHNEMVL